MDILILNKDKKKLDCVKIASDTIDGASFVHNGTEYCVDTVFEEGFLYSVTGSNGTLLYVWHCYDDTWLAIDPKIQQVEGLEIPTTSLRRDTSGFWATDNNSFAYYLNKNASTTISNVYLGSDHGLFRSCSRRFVVGTRLIPTINLSNVRKWMIWRNTADRCASCASMVLRCRMQGFCRPYMRRSVCLDKKASISYFTGVARVMSYVGQHIHPINGVTCDDHLAPQHAGYAYKGAYVLGVNDIVPISQAEQFLADELKIGYRFRSSKGKNNGYVSEDEIRAIPGFSKVEEVDQAMLNKLRENGGKVYT